MEKLKHIFRPGGEKDDSVLYGTPDPNDQLNPKAQPAQLTTDPAAEKHDHGIRRQLLYVSIVLTYCPVSALTSCQQPGWGQARRRAVRYHCTRRQAVGFPDIRHRVARCLRYYAD